MKFIDFWCQVLTGGKNHPTVQKVVSVQSANSLCENLYDMRVVTLRKAEGRHEFQVNQILR